MEGKLLASLSRTPLGLVLTPSAPLNPPLAPPKVLLTSYRKVKPLPKHHGSRIPTSATN